MRDPQCAPRMIDLRLAPAATATWAATWWATVHPAPWAAICVCVLATLSCAASYIHSHRGRRAPLHALTPPRSARLGLALLLACVACALAVGSTARRAYDADPAHRDSGPIHARVVLQSDPAPASSGFSATRSARVHVEAIAEGEVWLPSSTTALVRAPTWRDVARGDVYEVWGSLDTTFATDAPSVGTIRVKRAQLIERPGGLSTWMRSTHRAFTRACAPLPRDARALVPGMAIGDDRGMPADLALAMKNTSLTHLTAVSGSHIVIILATVTLIVPARKTLRLASTILVLGTILTLVGPEPSVVRSVCVAAVASLGLILGREGQSIAALCGVVIATLLIDPWAAHSYGFALSVLAALAVVGPSAALVRRCGRRIRGDTRVGKALRRLVEMVCVPAFAELATAPLIVSLSGNVPVWGIVANVLAEPAVPVATVAGLAGALVSPLSIRAASACAVVASWATAWIAGAARLCASLPGNGVHVPGGSSTVLGVYACCGGGWVAWRAWWRWGAPLADERGP